MTAAVDDLASPEDTGRRRKNRRPLVILLVLLCLLAAMVGGGLVWAKYAIESNLHTIGDPFAEVPNRPELPKAVEAEESVPTNILILGSDSRISAGDPSQWKYGAQRTDAIMLLHIPGDRKGAYVVSIPRDSWVEIPGNGYAKLNAAYSFGGPPLMIQTLESLTGARIDHFAVADFDSFAQLTDQLGGVVIDGQLLNGTEALAYARERYTLPRGDFDRIKRQQNWLRAMAASTAVTEARKDPSKVFGLVSAASTAVSVDDNLSLQEMVDLALDIRATGTSGVSYITTPVAGTGWSPDGTQSIVNLDQTAAAELFAAMANDQMAEYVQAHASQLDMLGDYVP
jgi:anionic cell wall polymer biosynthesis LytR-Cps2A-Psr (LCP) family protein